jgi:arsenate reductase
MLTIYHNPGCSKSRGALDLTQQFASNHQLDLHIVDYQKTPLTLEQLTELQRLLQAEGTFSVRDMMRTDDALFATLALQHGDDATLLQALATHPQLLQRPIVKFKERALVARPPELLNSFLHLP